MVGLISVELRGFEPLWAWALRLLACADRLVDRTATDTCELRKYAVAQSTTPHPEMRSPGEFAGHRWEKTQRYRQNFNRQQ